MAKHTQSVCGVDLRKDCICMAQYFPHDGSVASIIIKPLVLAGDAGWDELKSEFIDLISEIGFADQDVVCALGGENAIIKEVVLDAEEDDVRSVIEWEASQQIVGSLDDYIIDYEPLRPNPASPGQRFFVVAYRRDAVDQIQSIIKSAKLNPFILDIDIFALVNVFETNYKELMSTLVCIVSASADTLVVLLTSGGKLLDFEYRPIPADVIDGAGIQSIIEDSKATVFSANASLGTPQSTYLTGPLFVQEELATYLCAQMQTTEMLDPFRTISCRAEMSPADLKKHAPQLAVAVGLAVRGGTEVDA